MTEINSSVGPPSTFSSSKRVIPLPYALYESHGLLFELYDGGQPQRRHEVEWVRLKPAVAVGSAASESRSER
jgi:hypothetical protein